MKKVFGHWDLQAKISLVLVAVILPTFIIVTIAQNKLTLPILEEEIKQIGIHSGKVLASEIASSRVLFKSNPGLSLDNFLQEVLFSQPDIIRMDVLAKDSQGNVKVMASNIEEDPSTPPPVATLSESVVSEFKTDETGAGVWDIYVPIESRAKTQRKMIGSVHVVASTKLVSQMMVTLWKTTAAAAALSVVSLIFCLSYFLRKTLSNDRLLRQAESQNLQLSEQLHDAQRQLMTNEKLAVMGQLTASFAHEIGTPLNAIGGHLQLLKEEIGKVAPSEHLFDDRFLVVNGQLAKIECIVKGFLQSTAKPNSQRQLVDMNRLTEKTLGIISPRIDSIGAQVKRKFDRQMGPVRVVPLDLEQALLNLLNNSLDSMGSKARNRDKNSLVLEVKTQAIKSRGQEWSLIAIGDTGEGIKKSDLGNVLKPFFTTKGPGEGTGLGLTICQQIARKYGGDLTIDSKEGAWTWVTLKLPYHPNV